MVQRQVRVHGAPPPTGPENGQRRPETRLVAPVTVDDRETVAAVLDGAVVVSRTPPLGYLVSARSVPEAAVPGFLTAPRVGAAKAGRREDGRGFGSPSGTARRRTTDRCR